MNSYINELKTLIQKQLDEGDVVFAIFPYGEVGISANIILDVVYGIKPIAIFDNKICRYNEHIRPINEIIKIKSDKLRVLFCCTNSNIYKELKEQLEKYILPDYICELPSMTTFLHTDERIKTKIGKHSYGPICVNHECIESIGAFCSFASGVEVVGNHPVDLISTHPIFCAGQCIEGLEVEYEEYGRLKPRWYMDGVTPKREIKKQRRTVIGNDVWLGKNVLVTNGSCIGNGVIAAAGAVIVRDIPDYAVVAGVPARIIRYRYSEHQIRMLNEIKWWDWDDDLIKKRYDDFYVDIDEFIDKYK